MTVKNFQLMERHYLYPTIVLTNNGGNEDREKTTDVEDEDCWNSHSAVLPVNLIDPAHSHTLHKP